MRRAPIIFLTVAIVLASASADEVKVGRISYKPVQVTGFSDGKLTFVLSFRPVTKPLAGVVLITMDAREAFNEAERARLRDPQKAVGLYDTAAEAAWAPWEKDLIAFRRLDALGRAGMTGRWAEEWAAVLAGGRGTAAGKLRPGKLGDKAEIESAMERLKAALEETADNNTRLEISTVLDLLRGRLSTLQGQPEPPPENGQTPEPSGNGGQENGPKVTPPDVITITGSSTGKLIAFETMIKGGEADRAMREIDGFLKIAKSDELPRALFLGGVARMKVVKRIGSRRLLTEAGLMFMKVAVLYPESPESALSLYYAGEASELLGDAAGAIAAYRDVAMWADPDSEVAKRAAKKLKALQAGKTEGKSENESAERG